MAPDLAVVATAVFLPFLAAAAVPLVYRAVGERTAYAAAAVALVCFGLVGSQYGRSGTVAVDWIPSLGVELAFYVDGLSLLIGFLASGVGVLILAYSRGYMHGEPGQPRYYAALLVFMGSMLGLVFAANLLVLFVFWELTSISSYVLIGHYRQSEDSLYAARKSMLITVAGGLFMLVGFLVLYAVSAEPTALGEPTFDLVLLIENNEKVVAGLRETGLLWPVILLIGVGAAAKSAQVPLHLWLPNAMEAPTPVSAFLHSATMVKAGVYLVGRFRPLLSSPEWSAFFVALGLTTMTVAAALAVASTDIKELLAYSTASHLGLIVAGFGFLSEYGGEAGAFHVLNHASFKAALFLVAGIVAHEAGTRRIADLGGLARDLPVTAAVTAVAALSMAGVPPLNGFYSKELLFEATYHAAADAGGLAWLFPGVAVFGSVFTFLYSIRFLGLFLGEKPDGLGSVHGAPSVMVWPPLVLAGLVAGISLFPQAAVDAIVQGTFEGVGGQHAMHVGLPDHVTPALVMSAVTILLGLAAYPFYGELHRGLRRLLSVGPLTANWYYDGGVTALNRTSDLAVAQIQTGLLRTYASWVLGAGSALVLGAYAASNVGLPPFEGFQVGLPVELVLAIAVVAAVAVAIAPSHIAGVLTLSILGFMVAIFYILASAPDLALTQIVVETLVLLIFLLVLDKLPAFYGEIERRRAVRDGALSLVVGATVFVTVAVSTAGTPPIRLDAGVARDLVGRAVPEAGGHNVVNVILVDFRAFDTMGEIAVIAMAALSVITLVALRRRGETQ